METEESSESEEGATASRDQPPFHELNFFPLPSQSNIYGLVSLKLNNQNKLLVATLSGEIFRLEIDTHNLQSYWKPITFSYIPAEAEIISLDAFVREPNGIIVGVTLIKTTESKESYFNVYGLHTDPNIATKWGCVAEDWTPINLNFIPLKLLHTQIYLGNDSWETVFLITGNDFSVNMYMPVYASEVSLREEIPIEKWFPEFQDLHSSVTSVSIVTEGLQRYTAFGCQNGYIRCTIVDLSTNIVLKSICSSVFDGPITSVNLFTLSKVQSSGFNLLFTSALQLGAVFNDVFKFGLEIQPLVLPSSDEHDCVTCSTLGKISLNGQNYEAAIGTYGKKVLVYKLSQRDVHDNNMIEAELLWERGFAYPIYHIWIGDVTGDGLNEVVVLSSAGVHILQHDLRLAHSLCVKRLQDSLLTKE